MRRPIYENESNRQDERDAAKKIEAWASCKLTKLPYKDNIDWKATRDGKTVAFIEFKKRTNRRDQYSTYMIAHKKWLNGLKMASQYGVPFLLCIQWTDGLHYLVCQDDTPIIIASGGRTDRNDKKDIEQMVYIDTSLFKMIGV